MYEIETIRTTIVAPGHEHIELVGYRSGHIDEPIMISPQRVAERIAFDEAFAVTIGDEQVAVTSAPCPTCGEPGQLKSAKDSKDVQHLLALPQV